MTTSTPLFTRRRCTVCGVVRIEYANGRHKYRMAYQRNYLDICRASGHHTWHPPTTEETPTNGPNNAA
jgi:hypothetical protein